MSPLRDYWNDSKEPLTAMVLVLPLLMFYNVGLILTEWTALNGADFVTLGIIQWLGREGFLWFQATLGIVFSAVSFTSKERARFRLKSFCPC